MSNKNNSILTKSAQLKRKTIATHSSPSGTSLNASNTIIYYLVTFIERFKHEYAIVTSKQIILDNLVEKTGLVHHLEKNLSATSFINRVFFLF